MKLTNALLFIAPAAAFSPAVSINRPASALQMAEATETKVREKTKI